MLNKCLPSPVTANFKSTGMFVLKVCTLERVSCFLWGKNQET